MKNFQQRLYDHEVSPPTGVWDRIAAAMDEKQSYTFSQKLYDLQATPPPAVWDRIGQLLDEEQQHVKPVVRRSVVQMFVRYAAAAAILAAVAVTAFLVFDKRSNQGITDNEQQLIPEDSATSAKDTPSALQPLSAPVTATVTPSAPTRRVKASAAVYNPRRNRVSETDNADSEYSNSLYAYEDHVPTMAERYVMLMTPDGGFIRMSKKLGPLVCCVTGQEQDEQCKSQIKKWQEEIASSPVGQDNVLDVLDLVNSLNNNNRL
ncbi:MAG: hypothetical protein ABWZ25_17415 [Chitinophagaceae bacterium]